MKNATQGRKRERSHDTVMGASPNLVHDQHSQLDLSPEEDENDLNDGALSDWDTKSAVLEDSGPTTRRRERHYKAITVGLVNEFVNKASVPNPCKVFDFGNNGRSSASSQGFTRTGGQVHNALQFKQMHPQTPMM